jgi:hypothetical protein
VADKKPQMNPQHYAFWAVRGLYKPDNAEITAITQSAEKSGIITAVAKEATSNSRRTLLLKKKGKKWKTIPLDNLPAPFLKSEQESDE